MAQKSALLSLAQIVAAAVLGIFAGLFLGDYAAVFRPVGQVYIMLLEAAVYPYLIASLLHGLSSMAPDRAWRLFKNGWPLYLLVWGVTFGLLGLLSQAIPHPLPASMGTGTTTLSATTQHLIQLLIPSDFFTALSENSVPAVVVFCIAFGTALQQMKDKQALLGILDGIRAASFAFWSFVVRMVPIAVFSLLADTAGTIHLQNLSSLALFLFLFFVGILVLAFWVIPGCLQALTPLKYGEVIGNLRSGLILALITTLPASAIPFVIEATRNLAIRCGITDADRDDVTRAHLSVAYPLGQLGNFFVYLYILFAAFACGQAIPAAEQVFLPLMTLLSCFGTPASSVNAVTFIGNSFNLPASVNDLFVELMTVLRYGQVAASVMGYAFLSMTVVLAYYGKLKIRWGVLAGVLASAAIVILAVALSTRVVYTRYFENKPNPYLAFTLDKARDEAGLRFPSPARTTTPSRSPARHHSSASPAPASSVSATTQASSRSATAMLLAISSATMSPSPITSRASSTSNSSSSPTSGTTWSPGCAPARSTSPSPASTSPATACSTTASPSPTSAALSLSSPCATEAPTSSPASNSARARICALAFSATRSSSPS